ncbi:MAG TPA: PA2169 family four-helix-bundle protein [Kofleriaceae bacterium]|jgi:uncharacterized protein (TIGR02284 family)|nr:PA2169 family four-helix-bundle protein [Kofleriaceae bacterium]
MAITDVIDRLNDLIQLDHDAISAYDNCIERVGDDVALRTELEAFRGDHDTHVTELGDVVRDLGGTPRGTGREARSKLVEGLSAIRTAIGVEGALKAMRLTEQVTNRAYEDVLDEELPASARAVVEKNLGDERRHLAAIETHLDRLRRPLPQPPAAQI